MNRKKILLCGATGFIGKNILDRCIKDDLYDIIAVWHKKEPHCFSNNVTWVNCDLTDKNQVNDIMKNVDVVLQFACVNASGAKEGVSKPYLSVTDNAVMNSILLRACFENNIDHFLFPSCTVMYHSKDSKLKEEDSLPIRDPVEKYFGQGWTKIYLEKMCEFYSKISDIKFTVLRHSNIYGPYDKYNLEKSHVFAATILKVVDNTTGEVVVWGEGTEKRDFLHVEDFVDFVMMSVKNQKDNYLFLNVGSGVATSIGALVKKVVDISGKDLKITYDPTKPTIKTSLCLDSTKAFEKIGWKPKVSLEEGILKTINWYKESKGKK